MPSLESNRTCVYIDGFNFYYGLFRRHKKKPEFKWTTHLKWVNLNEFVCKLLPKNQILKIRYFTAKVATSKHDPQQLLRQKTYFRALETLPNFSIHYGHFLFYDVSLPLVNGAGLVNVIKSEEKRSDVNLATYMMLDGFRNEYDTAVIISNDSDFVELVKVVRRDLKKVVGVFSPHLTQSNELKINATFFRKIRPALLRKCQFPDEIQDITGTIRKPRDWQ